jgi:hypothetical protein
MIYINPDLGLLCKRLLVDNVVVFVKMIFHWSTEHNLYMKYNWSFISF